MRLICFRPEVCIVAVPFLCLRCPKCRHEATLHLALCFNKSQMRSMNYFSVSTKAFSTADQAYHNKLIMKKAAVFPLPLSL